MIQRKQTILLLLSIAVFVLSYYLPFGEFSSHQIFAYSVLDNNNQVVEGIQHYWFHAPYAVASFLALIAIFLFGNRQRQMAIVRVTFILYAATFALLAFYIRNAATSLDETEFAPGVSFFLVFGSFVCNMIALRMIKRDEQLVRSVDRIR